MPSPPSYFCQGVSSQRHGGGVENQLQPWSPGPCSKHPLPAFRCSPLPEFLIHSSLNQIQNFRYGGLSILGNNHTNTTVFPKMYLFSFFFFAALRLQSSTCKTRMLLLSYPAPTLVYSFPFLRQAVTMQPGLALNTCSTCLCLPNAGIINGAIAPGSKTYLCSKQATFLVMITLHPDRGAVCFVFVLNNPSHNPPWGDWSSAHLKRGAMPFTPHVYAFELCIETAFLDNM